MTAHVGGATAWRLEALDDLWPAGSPSRRGDAPGDFVRGMKTWLGRDVRWDADRLVFVEIVA
jgi:hypothetical protein